MCIPVCMFDDMNRYLYEWKCPNAYINFIQKKVRRYFEMRVIFMAKETPSSIEALQKLCDKRVMIVRAIIRDININLEKICKHYLISVCTEEQL